MKKNLFFILFLSVLTTYKSQTTIVDSIFVGGQYRSYRLYVPAIYNGTTARPLILNLHGYTSNAQQQQLYSNFSPIADTANFLMVFPNGTFSSGQRFWNAGISPLMVDDIGFLSALIDSLDLTYNINLNRVYSCGMSNGGFMSHTLACELSNRITAIASVTGSIFNQQYGTNCNPTRPVPVMQIHGTSDPTVPFAGSSTSMPIDSVVKYWVTKNGCNSTPTFSNVPNINTADGCTAEHYLYNNGLSGSTVEFYKIINGLHTWPGFPFGGVGTNLDMNASKEIWRFFSKYSLSVLTDVNNNFSHSVINVYPNPAKNQINIDLDNMYDEIHEIKIYDIVGKEITKSNLKTIDITNLQSGIYQISVTIKSGKSINSKFIKEN
jgi:polyhydroxybutyrate depolymerase